MDFLKVAFNLQEAIVGTTRDMLSNKNHLDVGPNSFIPENEQKLYSNCQFLGQVHYHSID